MVGFTISEGLLGKAADSTRMPVGNSIAEGFLKARSIKRKEELAAKELEMRNKKMALDQRNTERQLAMQEKGFQLDERKLQASIDDMNLRRQEMTKKSELEKDKLAQAAKHHEDDLAVDQERNRIAASKGGGKAATTQELAYSLRSAPTADKAKEAASKLYGISTDEIKAGLNANGDWIIQVGDNVDVIDTRWIAENTGAASATSLTQTDAVGKRQEKKFDQEVKMLNLKNEGELDLFHSKAKANPPTDAQAFAITKVITELYPDEDFSNINVLGLTIWGQALDEVEKTGKPIMTAAIDIAKNITVDEGDGIFSKAAGRLEQESTTSNAANARVNKGNKGTPGVFKLPSGEELEGVYYYEGGKRKFRAN